MTDQTHLTEIVLRHILLDLSASSKNYWSITQAWSSVSLLLSLRDRVKQESSAVVQEELQSLIKLVESQTPLLKADFIRDLFSP